MYATAHAVTTIFTTVNFGNEGAIDAGLMGDIPEYFRYFMTARVCAQIDAAFGDLRGARITHHEQTLLADSWSRCDEPFAHKAGLGEFSDRQIREVLRALAAKELSFTEIVGAYAKRGTKNADDLLEVQKGFDDPTYTCGGVTFFCLDAECRRQFLELFSNARSDHERIVRQEQQEEYRRVALQCQSRPLAQTVNG
jgi:hypothetical protein